MKEYGWDIISRLLDITQNTHKKTEIIYFYYLQKSYVVMQWSAIYILYHKKYVGTYPLSQEVLWQRKEINTTVNFKTKT
jgi:hypothetical protein